MIDCHTHWGRTWAERDASDPTRWLNVLSEYGVTNAVVLPEIGLIHAGKLSQDNDAIAAICATSNGRMIPFCTVNIWYRDEAIAELKRCLDKLNFHGVKFHTWLQGFSIGNPVIDDVCEIAAEHCAPILFHDGTPPFSLPSQAALLAKRHPKTQIILGHCGLLEHWREATASLNAASNLWGCLCGPHVAGIRHLLKNCDKSRLVWGSDFGYTMADCYAYRLQVMDAAGMTDTDREAIFIANARDLLRLKTT